MKRKPPGSDTIALGETEACSVLLVKVVFLVGGRGVGPYKESELWPQSRQQWLVLHAPFRITALRHSPIPSAVWKM